MRSVKKRSETKIMMKARKVKEVERSESRARRRTSMQADARQYIEMYIHASSLNIQGKHATTIA